MRFVVVLALGAALHAGGIRLAEVKDDDADCVASLKAIYSEMTLQRLFKPMLEGTYRLRNRYTGKYLSVTDSGVLGTTRAYIDDTHNSEWEIRRTDDFTPTYTMVNHHSKKDLTEYSGMAGADAFFFSLDGTGIYWSIQQELPQMPQDAEVYHFLTEDSSTNLAVFTTAVSGSDPQSEYLNWKKYWEFEIVGRPRGRLRPRGAKGEYEWQWTQASKIPMWCGSSYTWYDMCEEIGESSICPKGYAGMREYYQAAGLVSENGGNNVVTENSIGKCDTAITLERQRFQLPGLLQALKDTAGAACESYDLQTLSTLMKQAITEDCYSTCLIEIQAAIADISCDAIVSETWEDVFAQMRDSLTCNLSPSTILYLSDFAMQEKCWIWSIPGPLWVPGDQGPGATNLARADGNAVCSMESGAENDRSSSKIQQTGTCSEGTTCECPETWLKNHESLAAMRQVAFNAAYSEDGSADANFFVADYSSAWNGVTSTMARSMLIGSTVQLSIFGASLTAALLATPVGVPFITQTTLALFTFTKDAFSWTCDKVVGCWPAEPKRVNGACRFPDATESGGSPVWFMPTNGFYLRHRTWRASKCSLEFCKKEDLMTQRVEFTEREIYNCQFLSYADMSATQQSKYKEKLRLTLPSEYSSEI